MICDVYMFGLWGVRKSNLRVAYKMSDRILKLTSVLNSPIVRPQHNYFFIPTTQEQIII